MERRRKEQVKSRWECFPRRAKLKVRQSENLLRIIAYWLWKKKLNLNIHREKDLRCNANTRTDGLYVCIKIWHFLNRNLQVCVY